MAEQKVEQKTKTAQQRFRDVAKLRVEKIVHNSNLLSSMAGRSSYKYSDKQIDYIEETISESFANTIAALRDRKAQSRVRIPVE